IDPSGPYAARAHGAPTLQAFLPITPRLSLPSVVMGSIYVISSTTSGYATPGLFGAAIQTVGLEIAQKASSFLWPEAAAFAVLLILVFLALSYLVLRFVDIQQLF